MPDATDPTNQTEPPTELVERTARALFVRDAKYGENDPLWSEEAIRAIYSQRVRAVLAALPSDAVRLAPQGQVRADRESLGRLVREVWVQWATEQSDPKPSWLTGWDELDDGQREVDMRIGEALVRLAPQGEHPSQLAPAESLPEWKCPGCGATTRARMADHEDMVTADWNGLLTILDTHYPPDVFTGESGDAGPRLIVLTRELSRLRAENERLWRKLVIEEEEEESYDWQPLRRALATSATERITQLYEASARVLAVHADQVRSGKTQCPHPDHIEARDEAGTGDTIRLPDDAAEHIASFLTSGRVIPDSTASAAAIRLVAWMRDQFAARPCPSSATPGPPMSHNDGITDTAQPGDAYDLVARQMAKACGWEWASLSVGTRNSLSADAVGIVDVVKDAGLLAARPDTQDSLPLSSDPEEDQRLQAATIHAAETVWRGGDVGSVRVVVGNLLAMLGVPEPARQEPDPINEECTDVRCRRIDGRCVGMHCAKCGGPCGAQGHIGGCPPDQGNGDPACCEHPATAHDVSGDPEDPRPICCVDGCHCGRPATEAKGQEEPPAAQIPGWLEFPDADNRIITIFCPNCSTLMTVAEHEDHDCHPAQDTEVGG